MGVMLATGETTISAPDAPIREDYPSGQILGVLHRGDVVKVNGAEMHGDGFWVKVETIQKSKFDRPIAGFIVDSQTNFWPDFKAHKITQPPLADRKKPSR